MGQAVLRIEGLPEGALDAAATFHCEWLPKAREALRSGQALVMLFPTATYDHRGWRLAAVQDLAREATPKRANAIAGENDQAIAETISWLARALGITGQLLAVSPE